jgi:chromosome segregation ATPase
MTERLDTNIAQLNKVLDNVTEALVDISNKREEQNKTIYDMSQRFDLKTHTISEKINNLEKKINRVEYSNIENNNKSTSINKEINSNFNKKIINLEENITKMQQSLDALRLQYEENNRILNELRPKVGKKRKWWQIGI